MIVHYLDVNGKTKCATCNVQDTMRWVAANRHSCVKAIVEEGVFLVEDLTDIWIPPHRILKIEL